MFNKAINKVVSKNRVFTQDDQVALRKAWNNFTDSLCKDKLITVKQWDNWTQPY
jgi:hypothetical protein